MTYHFTWNTTVTLPPGDPYRREMRMIAEAWLLRLAELTKAPGAPLELLFITADSPNKKAIPAKIRKQLQKDLRIIEKEHARNCCLPTSVSTDILKMSLGDVRGQNGQLIEEHGDLTRNPAPFVNLFADSVVELTTAAVRLRSSLTQALLTARTEGECEAATAAVAAHYSVPAAIVTDALARFRETPIAYKKLSHEAAALERYLPRPE